MVEPDLRSRDVYEDDSSLMLVLSSERSGPRSLSFGLSEGLPSSGTMSSLSEHTAQFASNVFENNHWETLPDDVWQHVMTMVPTSTVASCSQTSKFWRHLATDEHIWEAQCIEAGIAQPWPRKSWKQSLQAKAAWKHLEGQWDIHWNQKFNRKLLDISSIMSPSVAIKNSIHASITEPRFVHMEGSNETVFVFNMSHEQSKRVFTYVITPISLHDTVLPHIKNQAVSQGSLRDMFSVQVLRHEDNVWYNAYLLRSDSPAAAQFTAEELNKAYNHREHHRPAFQIPEEVEMDEDSDSSSL